MGNTIALIPITCNNCGKKIGEGVIKDGIIAIKCGKCGTLNVQETKPTPSSKTTSS